MEGLISIRRRWTTVSVGFVVDVDMVVEMSLKLR